MAEALRKVIEYVFGAMNLLVIKAYPEASNTKSNILLDKCAFSRIGSVEEQGLANNRVYRLIVYGLDRSAWNQGGESIGACD